MGDPLRKPNDPFPESGAELGDIVPRDLGGAAGSPKPSIDRQDPSLFDVGPPAPVVDALPVAPSPQQSQRSLQETAPVPQGPGPVKNQLRRNRRGGFSFTLLIFGAIGMLAFGAGASLAYFILSGALDVDHSWIKENLSIIKNLVKEWRS